MWKFSYRETEIVISHTLVWAKQTVEGRGGLPNRVCSTHQTCSGNPSMFGAHNLQVLEQLKTQSFFDTLYYSHSLDFHVSLFRVTFLPLNHKNSSQDLASFFIVMHKSLIWGLILRVYGKENTPHTSKEWTMHWKISCLMVDFHQSAGRLKGALIGVRGTLDSSCRLDSENAALIEIFGRQHNKLSSWIPFIAANRYGTWTTEGQKSHSRIFLNIKYYLLDFFSTHGF